MLILPGFLCLLVLVPALFVGKMETFNINIIYIAMHARTTTIALPTCCVYVYHTSASCSQVVSVTFVNKNSY